MGRKSVDTGLTRERILSLFTYNRRDGTLSWRPRPVWMFNETAGRTAQHTCNLWNSQNARPGKIAGHPRKDGYREVGIDGRLYLVHLLIWCIEKGVWPDHEIDHRDTDPMNSRIGNLRKASSAQNQYNVGLRKDNKTGHKGVHFHKRTGKYVHSIAANGKKESAEHDTYEQACAARDEAARRLHGRYRKELA